MRDQDILVSPLHSLLKIAQRSKLLSPDSTKLTGHALRSLLAPLPLPSLMSESDAKDCLKYVEAKVYTRAAKRKLEAEAAAAAEEARKMACGAARRAKREAVAARPAKSVRVVSNTTRVWYECVLSSHFMKLRSSGHVCYKVPPPGDP